MNPARSRVRVVVYEVAIGVSYVHEQACSILILRDLTHLHVRGPMIMVMSRKLTEFVEMRVEKRYVCDLPENHL